MTTLRAQREIFQPAGRFTLPQVCVFFPTMSAGWVQGLTPPSNPAFKRSELIASDEEDASQRKCGRALRAVPSRSFKSNEDVCASNQEYLVKIKTGCRKRILAPILALQDKARQGTTSLCSLDRGRGMSTILPPCLLQAGGLWVGSAQATLALLHYPAG